MDVLSLILTCSLYPDEHLVRAMVEASSQGNQYFVGDLASLVTFDGAATAVDARALVTELEKQGGKPVLGLLGLPPAWASRGGKHRGDLFDACTNLRIGTILLADHYQTCLRTHSTRPTRSEGAGPLRPGRAAPPEAIRLCALRRFGAELGFEGYADAVLAYLPKQRILYAPPAFGDQAVRAAGPASGETCPTQQAPILDRSSATPRRRPGSAMSPSGAPILD